MFSGIRGGNSQLDIAAALNLGTKYVVNERAGIRLQARVQAPFYGLGLGLGVGTGGVNVGVRFIRMPCSLIYPEVFFLDYEKLYRPNSFIRSFV